jgi:hypothetical protein
MVGFAVYRMTRRPAPPLQEQLSTVPMARAAAVATALALEEGQATEEPGDEAGPVR